jgi:hypothetical protein
MEKYNGLSSSLSDFGSDNGVSQGDVGNGEKSRARN